jgi:hypothetical protein
LGYNQLDCIPEIAVEEALKKAQPIARVQADRLRVFVSICFPASGADRLIDQEVLSNHPARYSIPGNAIQQRSSAGSRRLGDAAKSVGTSATTTSRCSA